MSGIDIGDFPFPEVINVKRGDELRRYVPERTCRNASLDPLDFKCSECGAEDYASDSLTMWHEGGAVDICYCPVCGARIVEVSDDDRR